ncbi:MAG: adenine deaminase [Clostridium sp.]|nr:adenine deaminase [Clostridium sp.]
MKKIELIKRIKSTSKAITCDLVIKNISIVDVFTQECYLGDVAIKDGYIIGIGQYDSNNIIDGSNKYICPGLIDAHVHIESSLTTPIEYAKFALLHGITTVIADPHEIANVLGTKGIDIMLELSKNAPLDFYFMLPSCVPATPFENSGATLNNKDLLKFYSNPKVLGLGEVMDYSSLINCKNDMINKLLDCINNNKIIDGHCAGFNTNLTNVYRSINIRTDHECSTKEEVLDKLRRGLYILIREGTAAKNLNELIPLVNEKNSRRFCFCTDDKHIDELIKFGTIDSSILKSIEIGLNPSTAIQIATLNPAECYMLHNVGAIAPGYKADFLILDDLKNFKINKVFKNGNLVVSDNKLINNIESTIIKPNNSINIPKLTSDSFNIDLKNKSILNVIEINPNKLETNHLKINIDKLNLYSKFNSLTEYDLLKTAVIERHKSTGNIGIGILKGLKLKKGAIATTIAHDSHNIIVCGTNDEDMIYAVNELKDLGGGIIVVSNEKILGKVKLELAGLMTTRSINELLEDLTSIHDAIKILSPEIDFNPFLTLSFLALPVIPNIKLTDKGLFDVNNFKFIDVAE